MSREHSKEELYQRAAKLGVKGRSKMNKMELAQAIARAGLRSSVGRAPDRRGLRRATPNPSFSANPGWVEGSAAW